MGTQSVTSCARGNFFEYQTIYVCHSMASARNAKPEYD